MNCPIHRTRQLSENFFCADCAKHWEKETVEDFWKAYDVFSEERENEIRGVHARFHAKLEVLVKGII